MAVFGGVGNGFCSSTEGKNFEFLRTDSLLQYTMCFSMATMSEESVLELCLAGGAADAEHD